MSETMDFAYVIEKAIKKSLIPKLVEDLTVLNKQYSLEEKLQLHSKRSKNPMVSQKK